MKYKIITNGVKFRVKKWDEQLQAWTPVLDIVSTTVFEPEWTEKKNAQEWIDKQIERDKYDALEWKDCE